MKYQAPGLLAFGFLQKILSFCQTQSIITPLVIFSFVPLVINIGLAYVLVYVAGLGFIGAPIATSISMWIACVNTETISYMLTYGLSAVASTRVSNELGAGNVKGAKKATSVTVKLSLVLALVVVLALLVGHDGWVGLFSNSLVIKEEFASLRFLLAASITLDSIQGVFSGVARGCGWQLLVTAINLGTFYFIGMPIAAIFGFKLKFCAKGLWIGLICGLFCQILISLAYDNFPEVDKAECFSLKLVSVGT
ncbi:unnamed protein product [Arabis nemorensis]|uniref:Polysaccharide biosynthesis protein C-terminal domain-containing protein n=1 Tax=Arabis nemorensis TaxID=586526 RepID=A0A565BAD8_9BRAS|nr:unnamed protein product [Arabis nemorensis]